MLMTKAVHPLIIAIDGPAASGKGTLSRKIAEKYDLKHLDTGLTYRAVGNYLLAHDLPLDDETIATKAALAVDLGVLDRTILAQHHIGEAASKVAVMPKVRQALVDAQRNFAKTAGGAVLDGRDIGTVVCPNADVKLFVTASAGVRAGRRYEEIINAGREATYDDILADIQKRDARDMGRTDSPLRPAHDAHLLDTSELSIESAFAAACAIIHQAITAKDTNNS